MKNTKRVEARAIDVGYWNVKSTLGRRPSSDGSNAIACEMFPSLAPRLVCDPTKFADSSVGSRKTDSGGCYVDIDGVSYFVGRDAVLHTTGYEPRPVLDDYCLTPKYKALLKGALYYMALAEDADHLVIDQVVVGLPLSTFAQHRVALEELVKGEHVMRRSGGGASSTVRVTVDSVQAIVQPQGALLHHGVKRGGKMPEGGTLVVDVGGGTLDWFNCRSTARGPQANWQRSGAYPKAMLACAYAVANAIDPTWKDQFEIVERIDTAIRTNAGSFTVAGQQYEMEHYRSHVTAVLEEATAAMFASVGGVASLDLILVTGGGGAVVYNFLSQKHPKLKPVLHVDRGEGESDDSGHVDASQSIFSNVRGFQIAAEGLARAAR